MSNQNPYEQLGVTEDASFEDIQAARTRLLADHEGDRKRAESIEMAYDAVLMDRLRLRQEGRIAVPDRIRYPERTVERSTPTVEPTATRQMPAWIMNTIDRPERNDLLWPTGVMAVLAAAAILTPGTNGALLQLVLAAGSGATLFFLNRKEQKFGRSVLLSLAGLLVGLVLGTVVAGWLPVGWLLPEQATAVGTLLILWLASCFLR